MPLRPGPFTFIALLLALFAVTASTGAAADEPSPFSWESVDVEIDVQQNGDLLVTERQRHLPVGPGTREYVRILPLDFVDGIEDVQVLDAEGPIPASVQVQDNQISVRWLSTERGTSNPLFVLKYRAIGALHIHDTDDQVYWKPFFTDPNAPIQRGSVTVQLPDSLEGAVMGFNSYGQPATTARAIDPQTVEFLFDEAIDTSKTVEVQVIFPHGVLSGPLPLWQQKNSGSNLLRNLALGFYALALWRRRKESSTPPHSQEEY